MSDSEGNTDNWKRSINKLRDEQTPEPERPCSDNKSAMLGHDNVTNSPKRSSSSHDISRKRKHSKQKHKKTKRSKDSYVTKADLKQFENSVELTLQKLLQKQSRCNVGQTTNATS